MESICAKMAASLFQVRCKFWWILLFSALVASFFNVCVGKDLLHHSVLASCAIPLSRGDLKASRICVLSPVRIVISLNFY